MFLQVAQAAVIQPVSNPSNIVNFFNQGSAQWIPQMLFYANRLFLLLAGIEIAVLAARKIGEGGDAREAIWFFAVQVMVRGFFYGLLIEGPTWMFQIIDSFDQLGHKAASVAVQTPSGVMADALNISGRLLTQAFWKGVGFDTLTAVCYLLSAVAILIAFVIAAVNLAKFQIETFLTVRGAFIFLGFGGHSLTSPYAERYITMVIAAGVRLMILLLIIGFGHLFVVGWWTAMLDKSTYGAAGVKLAFQVAAEAWIYASICWGTPQMVAGILSGVPALSAQSTSGFIAPIVQSAMAGLTMLASGGTSVVSAAAGGAAGSAAGRVASLAARMAPSGAGGFGGGRSQPSAPLGGGPKQPTAPSPNEA